MSYLCMYKSIIFVVFMVWITMSRLRSNLFNLTVRATQICYQEPSGCHSTEVLRHSVTILFLHDGNGSSALTSRRSAWNVEGLTMVRINEDFTLSHSLSLRKPVERYHFRRNKWGQYCFIFSALMRTHLIGLPSTEHYHLQSLERHKLKIRALYVLNLLFYKILKSFYVVVLNIYDVHTVSPNTIKKLAQNLKMYSVLLNIIYVSIWSHQNTKGEGTTKSRKKIIT